MSDQQVVRESSEVKAAIIADVEYALTHKHGRQDLEVTAPYHQIIQNLKGEPIQVAERQPTEQHAVDEADREALRNAEDYRRAVREVQEASDLAYASSRDRMNIIKVGGQMDARDELRNGYQDLLKHMRDNPELAGQDAALMRQFQLAANAATQKEHLTPDQHDQRLAQMLHAHVHGVSQERVMMMVDQQSSGPER